MNLILLTNDDGIHSPALPALRQAMATVGEVVILAPDHNWSASSHIRTFHKPLRVYEAKLLDASPCLTTNGGPSDCVALAMLGVLERKPDLVVSGINLGANLAQDVILSGTVGAAIESIMSGSPAIAISLDARNGSDEGIHCAAGFAATLAQQVFRSGRKDILLNVNVPDVPCAEIAGVALTCLGKLVYRETLIERQDPHGLRYYWFGGERPRTVMQEGTDIAALAAKRISVTPLQLDLTSYPVLKELESWSLHIEPDSTNLPRVL